ncbi:MAG: glycosyltransferase family 4 protein [Lewinellaceae bacterium]|nr:glycosyltransferase family 4 protein [Lewinellaceae bacterium]
MNILIATYNYYPYNWGGSEVYVRGLVRYLHKQGIQATVLAAIPPEALKDCEVVFEDEFLKIGLYEYEQTTIIGCVLNPTTDEIYGRYNPRWKASWTAFFRQFQQGKEAFDLLHMNANTPLISPVLSEALREVFPNIKTLFSYHVPDSCPKGSLLYFDRENCTVNPNQQICTACTLNNRLGVAEPAAKLLAGLMPSSSLSPKLPSILRTKYLVGLSLKSFDLLSRQVDRWHVFGRQIRDFIIKKGIPSSHIALIQHGAEELYLTAGAGKDEREQMHETIFIFIGRFKKIKGLHTLLKAWMGLEQSDSRRLWVVGDGKDMKPDLVKLLEKAKTRTDIEFLGTMEAAALKDKTAQAHCIVIPSEWVEIGPLVLHESVAVGTNVIASNVGGCGALVEYYGEGCQTFRMGDVADLQQKIRDFKYQPIHKKVMGQTEHYGLVLKEFNKLLEQNIHATI